MADERIPLAGTPVYEVLSEAQVQKIVDAIFQLLRETGVAFDPDPRVLDLFSDAGCDISADHVVRFETDFVKECLQSLAKTAKIWNRDGTDFHEMREGNTVFRTSMTCIRVFDLETGERPRQHHAGGRRAAERGRRVPDGQGRSGLDPAR
jgi:trimethylamine:corrinoid methyltransferase-like protein